MNELTLKEAVQLADQHAKKMDVNYQLLYVTSVDEEPNEETMHSGDEGKRRLWNLIFGVPHSNKGLTVRVENGKVLRSHQVQETVQSEMVFRQQDIQWDSPAILKIAKTKYDLKPSQGFGKGYHFKVVKDQGVLFFGVSGWDSSGKAKTIYFNSENGEYLGMEISN